MRFRDKWSTSWSFVKKLQFFLVSVILCITLLAIMVSTVSWVYSITEQNQQSVEEQLEMMASEYSSTLEQYKAVAVSIVLDQNVQKYCAFRENKKELEGAASSVYSMLLNMLNIQVNANFIAVINESLNTYVYNGSYSMSGSNFGSTYQEDYATGIQAKEKGTLRLSFADHYFYNLRYTLTLYFPVYSVTSLDTVNGMVVINMDDSLLEHLNSRKKFTSSSLYLTDIAGNVVSHQDAGKIGTKTEYAGRIKGNQGAFWERGTQISYQRVGDWNYYLINEIPGSYLYQNALSVIIGMLIIMVIVIIISLSIANRMAKGLYKPIDTIIASMSNVSAGNLRSRIKTDQMDRDGLQLAGGFNSMMDEIDVLMEQVKEEQHKIDQMKFNGLQSQIQPHFLYNTLDCIHWQAVTEGNKEISTMVKALAQYYRICLSEGQDIIPLKKELEHIENYVIIQNMRYDDIIEIGISVPDEYLEIPIPKLTLQPLVENSIYHGMKSKEGKKGKIDIYMKVTPPYLRLYVADNGVGMSEERINYINRHITHFDREIGYGINNVNKRIELHYGSPYGLYFYHGAQGGTVVEIRLPGQEAEDVQDSDS